VKKQKRGIETVPVSEAVKKTAETKVKKSVEKLGKKEAP
jgi:hypothetical protein